MKKLIFAISIAFILLISAGCSFANKNSSFCADCGKGGWEKMEYKCAGKISDSSDFKACLESYAWSSVNESTSLEEFKEGYIEMGGLKILDRPTANSIKIFNYHQWSVDENGQLYLLGQLG